MLLDKKWPRDFNIFDHPDMCLHLVHGLIHPLWEKVDKNVPRKLFEFLMNDIGIENVFRFCNIYNG